jgi:hypothetical protein
MTFTTESTQSIFPNTQIATVVPKITEQFKNLKAEDQLALIWFAFAEMGKTVTVAAPGAVNMIFAKGLLDQIQKMSPAEQTQVMCDLANHADTPICQTYGAFNVNIKLGFWNQLGEWMEQGLVAPIPAHYQLSSSASQVLEAIKRAEPGQQITILRNTVVDMGYDSTNSGQKKVVVGPDVVPTQMADRTQTQIEGINHPTILGYIDNMNANDFEAAVNLFAPDGVLQPPFQKPITGREAILTYMREECQGLKMAPQRGVVESAEDGYTPIKVTGKVQTPWFGNSVGMNIAWRFLLNSQSQIVFVAIDLLASPQELLNLTR